MRICYALAGDYTWDTRAEKMIGSLVSAGHEVFLLCARPFEQPFREPREGLRICPIPLSPWLPERFKSRLLAPVFFSRPWTNWINTVAVENDCDVIVVRDLPLALAGIVVGDRLRRPVVLDLADNYPASLGNPIGGVAAIRRDRVLRSPAVAGIVEDAAISRAARVIVACEEMHKRIIQRNVDVANATIIRNTPPLRTVPKAAGVDPARRANSFTMVYGGPVEAWAGLDTVLRALPDIRVRIPGATLVIAGTGSEIESLQSIARQLGVRRAVEFAATDHPASVAACIERADLCVLPHHRQAHSDSALPAMLFEYMAHGRAILTSDAAPLERTVEEEFCGASFRSGDPLSFARAVSDFRNGAYRQQLGESGRRAVLERYHWEHEATVLNELFAGLQSNAAGVALDQGASAVEGAPMLAVPAVLDRALVVPSEQASSESTPASAPNFPPMFEVVSRALLDALAGDDPDAARADKYALELHSARQDGSAVFRVVLQKRTPEDSPLRPQSPSRREWLHSSLEEAGRSFASLSSESSAVRIVHRDILLVPQR